ncbi:hypothetical protein VULLAG_LOCUS22283 [Vulpes lagopus]
MHLVARSRGRHKAHARPITETWGNPGPWGPKALVAPQTHSPQPRGHQAGPPSGRDSPPPAQCWARPHMRPKPISEARGFSEAREGVQECRKQSGSPLRGAGGVLSLPTAGATLTGGRCSAHRQQVPLPGGRCRAHRCRRG